MIDGLMNGKIKSAKRASRSRRALPAIGLLLVLMIVAPAYGSEPAGSAPSIGMQSGMVTAVRAHTVAIDGTEFGFSPKVVVLDPNGQKVELSYIVWNSAVQFRVMQEDMRKIERIIVHQPE